MTEATAQSTTAAETDRQSGTGSYPVRPSLHWLGWFALIAGGGAALIALGLGVQRWLLAYTQYGPAVVWRWSLPWFAVAAGLMPAPLLALLSLWRARHVHVLTYPSGMVYEGGRQSWSFAWPEVTALRTTGPWGGLFGLTGGPPSTLHIDLQDGRQLRLGRDLIGFEQLVEHIKRKVYPRLHKAMAAAFNQGEFLSFGPVTLAQDGVLTQQRRLPWSEVVGAAIQKGALEIRYRSGKGARSLRLAIDRVPNPELCVDMIDSLRHPA